MKNLLKACVLTVAMLVLMCGAAGATDFNAQGSALIPKISHYLSQSFTSRDTEFYFTNITGSAVQCKLTVFDHNGNDVSSLCSVYTGGSSQTEVSRGTGSFELPAYSTRYIVFGAINNTITSIYGYGIIKWTSNDPNLSKALIGTCGEIAINNGQPF